MPGYRRTVRVWRHRSPSSGAAGGEKVFREVASGAKTNRNQLCRALDYLAVGNVLMVTRLARSTRDLLNILAAIAAQKAGFRSLSDAWADTTTAHGRLC
jgi:DNA invertase Pin-like site-specific DNA recombinase